jgi:hypothetical protein
MMDPYCETLPNCGDLFTVEAFRQAFADGCFKDRDGYGHPARDGRMNPNVLVYPSTSIYPKSATHVVWFNK